MKSYFPKAVSYNRFVELENPMWSQIAPRPENIPPKGVSFSDVICIFAMSYQSFACLFCNTKISELFDMAKFWAARLCRLPKQELFVAQALKKFKL